MTSSRFKRTFVAFAALLAPSRCLSGAMSHAPPRHDLASHGSCHREPGVKHCRQHVPNPIVACAHHAVGGLWFLRRGSTVQTSRHALRLPSWSAVSAGGVVLVTTARATMMHLKKSDRESGPPKAAEESVKSAMIGFIKAYKKELSPLMPPACRFLPTCSVYAVEAIEKFGPVKGAVLTAWRLMRCNPFAGYGTDYPRWPPPGWFAGEKW